MSERDFLRDEALQKAAETVCAVEALTSAEVVIAVRRRSGVYRHVDLLFGAVLAFAVVVGLLVAPVTFHPVTIPVDLAIAFAAGTALCARWPRLRRALIAPSLMRQRVRESARAAFHDLGISRCTGRNGVLVFVSLFERTVEVVPDLGIDPAVHGEPWEGAVGRMSEAVRSLDFERFLAAVAELGPVLAPVHPRREDDVNELPDTVEAS